MSEPKKIYWRPGIWIVLAIAAVFALRMGLRESRYPHQVKAMARMLSGISIIQKTPVANHAGTAVAVIRTTKEGVGMFIINPKTQEETKLVEVSDVNYMPSRTWTFGWSPDDKYFAYSVSNMFFCDGAGRTVISKVEVPDGCIEPFTWLSSEACAYVSREAKLVLVQLANGQWKEAASWPLPSGRGQPRSLVATDTNSVVWQTDDEIYRMDMTTGAASPIYSSRPRTISGISYLADTKEFLCLENTNRSSTTYLMRLFGDGGELSRKELMHRSSITAAQWIDRGNGYAYVVNRGTNSVLALKRAPQYRESLLFTNGNVWNINYGDQGATIYALASQGGEPAGVWQCKDGKADCVVSSWGRTKAEFQFQPVQHKSAVYEQAGKTHYADYDLIAPSGFSTHKKYPLIIGTAGYEWTPIPHGVYAQSLAHCGAYVALVNYRWNQRNPETVYELTNNVQAVYNQLAKNPNIDLNHVYLFGFSAGTVVVSELVKSYPGRWRGIMLLNPSPFPKAEPGMVSKVLATAGSGEGQEERFRRYQEELFKVGIPMEWHIHQNASHVVRAQDAMYERTLWMADMIFKD